MPTPPDRATPAARYSARPRQRDDRASTTVEIVVLFPVMMLLLTSVVQAGIYFHTRAVAVSAARKAASVAAEDGSSAGQGRAAATEFLAENGGALLHRSVVVTRTGTAADATVHGSVESVLIGVPFTVTVHVEQPVEVVTP
jgi:Flp pilus assembly protein TadG